MDLSRIRKLSGVESNRPGLEEDSEVGKIIAQQLGGPGKLRMMLGAKNVTLIDKGLSFKWPSQQRTRGNGVRITLDPSDTYTMEFFNGAKSVKKYEGIYNDQLVSTFENQTGLYLNFSGPKAKAPVESVEELGEGFSELKSLLDAAAPYAADVKTPDNKYKTAGDIPTPKNKSPKPPKMLKGKALDKEIERVYYKHGNGVQINIMDIGKIFREVRAAYEKGEDYEASVQACIKKFRQN